MNSVFDRARLISAHEAAAREGLPLQQRGQRWWVQCPLHGEGRERTPSLCLYRDGGWHCFGCGAGGSDGASFLAALRGISQLAAARMLAEGVTGPVPPVSAARALQRQTEAFRRAVVDRLHILLALLEVSRTLAMRGVDPGNEFPAALVATIRAREDTLLLLFEVESASPTEIYHWWKVAERIGDRCSA